MAVSAVLVLLALLVVGYVAARLGAFTTQGVDVLNRFAFLVAFPALAFLSLWQAPVDLALDWRPYVASLAAVAVGAAAAWGAARVLGLRRETTAVVVFGVLFANTSYIGIPLNGLAFGSDGAAQAALIAGLLNVTGLPLGMLLVARAGGAAADHALRTVARTPLVVAAILGVVGAAVRATWGLPRELPVVNLLAASAAPVGLFAIGGFFALQARVRDAAPAPLTAGLAARLLVAPAVAFLVATALGLTGMPLAVTVLQAGMPVGITVFVATRALGGQAGFAAAYLLVSVVLGMGTLAGLLTLLS